MMMLSPRHQANVERGRASNLARRSEGEHRVLLLGHHEPYAVGHQKARRSDEPQHGHILTAGHERAAENRRDAGYSYGIDVRGDARRLAHGRTSRCRAEPSDRSDAKRSTTDSGRGASVPLVIGCADVFFARRHRTPRHPWLRSKVAAAFHGDNAPRGRRPSEVQVELPRVRRIAHPLS